MYIPDPTLPAWVWCHNVHRLIIYSCFRFAQFCRRHGLGLYFKGAVTITIAARANIPQQGLKDTGGLGWTSLQTLFSSWGSLLILELMPWIVQTCYAAGLLSQLGICGEKHVAFKEEQAKTFASSKSSFLHPLRHQTHGVPNRDEVTPQQDTQRCYFALPAEVDSFCTRGPSTSFPQFLQSFVRN